MTKRNPELRLIDSEMARLRLRRKLIALQERQARLRTDLADTIDALTAERQRTTPDSVTAIADTRLATLLAEARAENSKLRGDLAMRSGDTQRLHEATRAIEQMRDANQELTERLGRTRREGADAEVERIAGWLSAEAAKCDQMADHSPVANDHARSAAAVLSNAAREIEKGAHREPR